MIIYGDCKTELKKIEKNSVDLVYLDPPFFTQKTQVLKNRENKEYLFEDNWKSIFVYKRYIQERLEECKDVIKNTGSIFLHCDRSASHYLRMALDEVFGANNFQSEIIWVYKRWSNSKRGLLNAHQIIYFYSKTSDFKFNHTYTNYSTTTNIDQIFQKRVRNMNGKTEYKLCKDGNPDLVREKKGVPLSDVWEIPYLNPKAKERVGYPTQKPIVLLERIIKLVTDKGDIVLDPFCGSGTTLIASKILKRKYIGIDKSKDAIEITKQRLHNPIKSISNILTKGKDYFIKQDPNILKILNRLNIIPVQRNKGIDGFLRTETSFVPIPVRIQKNDETLDMTIELLLKACQKNDYKKKIIIKTNNLKNQQTLPFFNRGIDESIIIIDNPDCFQEEKEKLLQSLLGSI